MSLKKVFCIMTVITVIIGSLLSANQELVYASTIVHLDRNSRDKRVSESNQQKVAEEKQPESVEQEQTKVAEQKKPTVSKQEQPANNSEPVQSKVTTSTSEPARSSEPYKETNVSSNRTNSIGTPYRTPSPMTFSQAEAYSKKFPNEITYHTFKMKDTFGNKNHKRFFDFLKEKGIYHSGSTITGVGETSAIRFSIDYGFENIPSSPVATIGWLIGTTGDWGTSFLPKTINFVFDEGDTVTIYIPLKSINYNARVNNGIFYTALLKQYHGVVTLTPQDLYLLSNHRQLRAAYISDGSNITIHLFYSGDKDKDEKEAVMRGFRHASKMLDISYETVVDLTKLQQDTEEQMRRAALLDSVSREIERDKLKEAILDKMDAQRRNKQ